MHPRRINGPRRKAIAESLSLPPSIVGGLTCHLEHLRYDRLLKLRDAVTQVDRVFSVQVVHVLKKSELVAQELGDEFVDSAHWLLSLYDCGSAVMRARLLEIGLSRDLMVESRVALEGRIADLGGNRRGLHLSEDGVKTFLHLKKIRDSSGCELLDEKMFAVGLMRAGHSKAAAILKARNIDMSDFIENL